MPNTEEPPLLEKIDQMLTEARMILPGAQALLGFQFIAVLTKRFTELPESTQLVHFSALGFILVAIMLLIAPAAVHRLGFGGQFTDRMHKVGSALVSAALVPLAAGIAADIYVALARATPPGSLPLIGGATSFFLLIALWYALPLSIRAQHRRRKA